jgi:hypothetical protein
MVLGGVTHMQHTPLTLMYNQTWVDGFRLATAARGGRAVAGGCQEPYPPGPAGWHRQKALAA